MAWKDDELKYIQILLESRGNESVPRSTIPSYLKTQAVSAKMDGETKIAGAITIAMGCWMKGNYGDAVRVIREARAWEVE